MQAEVAQQGAFRHLVSKFDELQKVAQGLRARFPNDSEVSLLLADTLLAAGRANLALVEYRKAQELVLPNQTRRVQQGIRQCLENRDQFPAFVAKRLQTAEYADGVNGEIWRDYVERDIQRGREIARIVRQRAPLRGRRMLDVGCGYGGTLIAFAEQGSDTFGVEIDQGWAKVVGAVPS